MKHLKAGIHTISLEDYLADPCVAPSLSSHVAHALLEQSPLHAWNLHPRLNAHYEPEQNGKFDLGSACHAVLLEGDLDKLAVIDADDYRTKAAQVEREAARKAGKIPVLEAQKRVIEDMVGQAQEAICKSELEYAFKPSQGDSEVTLIWQEHGIWCRIRPDRLAKDRRLIVSYKTTGASAEPTAWVKGPLIGNGCDIQAAMELRGVTAVCKPEHAPAYVYVVQETSPPYAVSFVGFGEQFKFYADARLQRAIELWGKCLKTNRWPGYPSRVAWVEPPPYKCTEWDAQVEEADKEHA